MILASSARLRQPPASAARQGHGPDVRPTRAAAPGPQHEGMTTNNAPTASSTGHRDSAAHRDAATASGAAKPPRPAWRFSPLLSASAAGMFAVGVASGLDRYLNRSPIREVHIGGTAAWTQHFIVAAVCCAAYGYAVWRRRRAGARGGRPLLLAPLGKTAAARLIATLRQASWRTIAALLPLGMIAYGFWRAGEQVTAGLDPNFTVNAWGGPTYLGAMACHYLDGGLMIAACAWLLSKILLPAAREGENG